MGDSAVMEQTIDALLKNTKMKMQDKVLVLNQLFLENHGIIDSLVSGVPAGLADGLNAFTAGCTERTAFLSEFSSYAQDRSLADGSMALYNGYAAFRKQYLDDASLYAPGSDEAKVFQQLAAQQQAFATAEKARYDDYLKQAAAHKAAYEASRIKYLALFAG
jgi:hypothetical protein